MKKKVVMVAAALLLGTASFAQTAGPRGGAPGAAGQGQRGQAQRGAGGMQIEKNVFDKLGLSAAQKQKIEALQKNQAAKMKEMRDKAKASGAKPDRTAMQASMKKMREEHLASLKSILTPAQFTKYQELMKAEMEKFRKEHAGQAGAGGAKGAKGGKAGGKAGGGF